MKRSFRLSRRNAWLLVATVATLVLSIVFDLTVFATALFPALWVASLQDRGCAPRHGDVA
ncbi:hypothetical protein [Cognatilysobacter lacus]|uniref:Uncharacterized protein n=1 Tax=Cognatilysobacter lacus TaxID=1643323 RepID=A0A5D8Z612_9GAMM|nr:hypothetical protein [Lysobacter lacus]TZF90090.1 hypothetical protein FW784_06680 [Lysobacter lacus]